MTWTLISPYPTNQKNRAGETVTFSSLHGCPVSARHKSCPCWHLTLGSYCPVSLHFLSQALGAWHFIIYGNSPLLCALCCGFVPPPFAGLLFMVYMTWFCLHCCQSDWIEWSHPSGRCRLACQSRVASWWEGMASDGRAGGGDWCLGQVELQVGEEVTCGGGEWFRPLDPLNSHSFHDLNQMGTLKNWLGSCFFPDLFRQGGNNF